MGDDRVRPFWILDFRFWILDFGFCGKLRCGECSVVLGSQRCRRVSRRRRLALVSPMNNYRASFRGASLTRSVSEGDTRRGVPPVEQTFQDGFWIVKELLHKLFFLSIGRNNFSNWYKTREIKGNIYPYQSASTMRSPFFKLRIPATTILSPACNPDITW